MTDSSEIHAGTAGDETKIVVNSLYLSLAFLLDQIERVGGRDAAVDAREALIENLTYGNIDMAINGGSKDF